jgi:hypothetical protein
VAAKIRSIDKSNDLIKNQTHDLPACSKVPQPTMLPRAPQHTLEKHILDVCCAKAARKVLEEAENIT